MRVIPLRPLTGLGAGEGAPSSTADLMLHVLRSPREAVSVGQMERALSVIGAIDAARRAGEGIVALEEADHAHLAAIMQDARWTIVDAQIVQMVKDICDAPQQAPQAAAPKPGRR
jgi:hypothetical protein